MPEHSCASYRTCGDCRSLGRPREWSWRRGKAGVLARPARATHRGAGRRAAACCGPARARISQSTRSAHGHSHATPYWSQFATRVRGDVFVPGGKRAPQRAISVLGRPGRRHNRRPRHTACTPHRSLGSVVRGRGPMVERLRYTGSRRRYHPGPHLRSREPAPGDSRRGGIRGDAVPAVLPRTDGARTLRI